MNLKSDFSERIFINRKISNKSFEPYGKALSLIPGHVAFDKTINKNPLE